MIINSPFNGTTPKIHQTAFIAPDVVIIGDVEIGAYTNIWFGAKLRGDWGKIVVGENTSIQENAVLHSYPKEVCRIGSNVRLAHLSMCHGPCTVGDYSLVGINATVLQGAKLGNGCILAAGSLLRKETDDFCLYVGVPASKKKDNLSRKFNEVSSNLYIENGQKFKEAGYSQKVPKEYLIIEK
ncbi:MAG: gamma carbonic anhydrase family protein [Promethearchaeota archaeon]|nr:MAG: gamma carbonic anhydrase family protein [Candidatus Lokiarchaeota archaeon]